jgi:hypothetical protein
MKLGVLVTATVALTLGNAGAAVVISDTASLKADIDGSGNILDNLTVASSTDTTVFLLFSQDATNPITAIFAGQAMTIVNDGPRSVIAYLANPTSLSGDLVVNGASTNTGVFELAYWGVASGIDTSAIQTSLGSTASGGSQSITSFSSLNSDDVVYSVFSVNNYNVTAYSGGLIVQDGGAGDHDAIITTDIVGIDGAFTPSVTTAATTPLYGASIAFTAIPEPSSAALLGGLLARGTSCCFVAVRSLSCFRL